MGPPPESRTELRTRIRQQEVVAELGKQALEDDDLDQLMHDSAAAVADTLGNDYCKVLELLPSGDVFLRQGVGWQDGLVGKAAVPTDLDSQAGYTLISEEPIIVDDLRTEERFTGPELLIEHDVVSGISVIIGTVDDPWGVLGTHTTDQREFTKHDVHFVQSVANLLAAAIKRHTYQDELEETVEQLRASNERLESFASMLAHELRNPVTIGQIYVQQLSEETASQAIEYITEAFDRLEDAIDVMLLLTQEEDAVDDLTYISIAEIARNVWDKIETREATLSIELDLVVRADDVYIRHLFRNLFENAIKHGGTDITIPVGEIADGFYVADDGSGIPVDDREAVFEAGFTTAANEGGSGLGLAVVQQLAEVYGWECTLTDSATGGARFEFKGVSNPTRN